MALHTHLGSMKTGRLSEYGFEITQFLRSVFWNIVSDIVSVSLLGRSLIPPLPSALKRDFDFLSGVGRARDVPNGSNWENLAQSRTPLVFPSNIYSSGHLLFSSWCKYFDGINGINSCGLIRQHIFTFGF